MSPKAQRIAIAEVCGWTGPMRFEWLPAASLGGDNMWTDCAMKGGFLQAVPDYLNDLNAMHEAEKVLIPAGRTAAFYGELVGVTTVDRFFLVHATAAQRAEAFLRTIGRWDDSQ